MLGRTGPFAEYGNMQTESRTIAPDRLRDWMVNYICSVLDLDRGSFQTAERFDRYGLDSVEAVIMAGVMEEEFAVQIDPIELFEHPSVDEFVATFVQRQTAEP
jgi:acyl carrier protein